jgi:hypothetical protein
VSVLYDIVASKMRKSQTMEIHLCHLYLLLRHDCICPFELEEGGTRLTFGGGGGGSSTRSHLLYCYMEIWKTISFKMNKLQNRYKNYVTLKQNTCGVKQ